MTQPHSDALDPGHVENVLRVRAPVVVTLASRRESVQKLSQIAVGTILQFDAPYDEMLEISVGERKIGLGEAIKIGDKYGVRVAQTS